jgi:hypothetical protein
MGHLLLLALTEGLRKGVGERGGVAAVEGRVVEWWRNVAEARWRRRRVVGNG